MTASSWTTVLYVVALVLSGCNSKAGFESASNRTTAESGDADDDLADGSSGGVEGNAGDHGQDALPKVQVRESVGDDRNPKPRFTWDPVEGASSYTVAVAASSACDRPSISQAGLTSTSHQFDQPLNDGDWYLCIDAVDAAGGVLAHGSVAFKIDTKAPASAAFSISGAPEVASKLDVQNWLIVGPEPVLVRTKVGSAASTDCAIEAGYGAAHRYETTGESFDVASFGEEGLAACIWLGDLAGNWQPLAEAIRRVWTKDTTQPTIQASDYDLILNATATIDVTISDVGEWTSAWQKISGPGSMTFGTPDGDDTTVSASQDGEYVVRITVTDAAGNTQVADFDITWNSSALLVDAGPTIATNIGRLMAATVSGIPALSFAWTQVSGPGTASFSDPQVEDPTVTADVDGTYVLRLTVTDGLAATAYDDVTFRWDTADPVVDVGADRVAGSQVTLNVTTSDAGSMTYQWTKVSGPGTITFGTPVSEDTTVVASVSGTYALRLTATDAAGNTASDTFTLVWDQDDPTVNAGTDQVSSGVVSLNASSSDATARTYLWSKQSGPGSVSFADASSEDTTVTFGADGTYVLRLTVTDAVGRAAHDDLVVVKDSGDPTVDVGADKTARTSITINATVSDATAMTYSWSKVSGPGTVNFQSPTGASTAVTTTLDGTYVLRLTVTDAAGNDASDELTFVWDTTNPTVDAGTDVDAGSLASLDASASDATALTYSWSKQSGPGVVTFGSANQEDTTASAAADGDYVLRLTVTDAAGNVAHDDVGFHWDQSDPSVDVGSDLVGSGSYTLTATTLDASDLTFQWSQRSGPGTVSFADAAAEDTSASIDLDGSYVLRLTVVDALGNSAFDELTIVKDSLAPSVDVGADLVAGASIALNASTSDDLTMTYAWTKVSGPGAVTFQSPTSESTNVTTNADGSYVLRLTATDAAGNSASDTLTLVWDTADPVVSAGSDVVAAIATGLNASVTDATSLSFAWTKVSGPGVVTFGSANQEDTTASANVEGDYVLRLTATDAIGNSAFDDIAFRWDQTPPSVNAGSDKTVKASVSQDATVSDASSMTYSWTKDSGPGVLSFGSATAVDTTIGANADGTYVVRLTATDAAGNSSSDTMTLVWDTTAPSVDAGSDITTRVSATAAATVTDALSAVTYAWTKVSGPGTVTFTDADDEDPNISVSQAGTYVLRLTATDLANNSASDTVQFIADQTAPSAATGLSVTPGIGSNTLAYSFVSDGGQNSVLIVQRIGSAVTWTPNAGQSYAVNDESSGQKVVYIGSANSFVDSGLNSSNTYHYAVFVLDSVGNYASAATGSGQPQAAQAIQKIGQLGGPLTDVVGSGNGYVYAVAGPELRHVPYDIWGFEYGTAITHGVPGEDFKLSISGNYLLISSNSDMAIFDVSTPTSPSKITTSLNLTFIDAHVSGSTLTLCRTNGVTTYDISTIATPTLRDTYVVSDVESCKFSSNIVSLARGGATPGVTLVSLADPDDLVSPLEMSGPYAGAAVLSGTTLYVSIDGEIRSYDATNLSAPVLLHTEYWYPCVEMIVVGSRLFCSDGLVAYSYDVTDPSAFFIESPNSFEATHFADVGSGLVVVWSDTSSSMALFSEFDQMTVIGRRYLGLTPSSVVIDSGALYLLDVYTGLQAFALNDIMTAPYDLRMNLPTVAPGEMFGPLYVSGSAIVMAFYGWGVHSYDISQSGTIVPLRSQLDVNLTLQPALAGSKYFIANASSRTVSFVETSDPDNLVAGAEFDGSALGSSLGAIAATGDTVYVASNNAGTWSVSRIDFSGTPSLVATLVVPSSSGISNLKVVGSYVFAAGFNRIDILDFSNPTSPVVRTPLITSSVSPGTMFVHGSHLYVDLGTVPSRTNIYDISSPLSPSLAAQTPVGLPLDLLYIDADYAIGKSAKAGISFYDGLPSQ